VKEGGSGKGEVVWLDQRAANEKRVGVGKSVLAALGGDQLVPAGSKRRQPATTRQPVQHLAGMVVRAAQDSHGLVNGHHGLFLPFEVEDQPGFQVRQRSRHEQHLNE